MYLINISDNPNKLQIQVRAVEKTAKIRLKGKEWISPKNDEVIIFDKNKDESNEYIVEIENDGIISSVIFENNLQEIKIPENFNRTGMPEELKIKDLTKYKKKVFKKMGKYKVGGDI